VLGHERMCSETWKITVRGMVLLVPSTMKKGKRSKSGKSGKFGRRGGFLCTGDRKAGEFAVGQPEITEGGSEMNERMKGDYECKCLACPQYASFANTEATRDYFI